MRADRDLLKLFEDYKEHTGDPSVAVGLLLAHVLSDHPKAAPLSESFTVTQAAEYLNVSEDVIWKVCKAGRLDHYRIGTGRGTIRIMRAALDAYRKDAEVAARNPASELDPLEGHRRLLRERKEK